MDNPFQKPVKPFVNPFLDMAKAHEQGANSLIAHIVENQPVAVSYEGKNYELVANPVAAPVAPTVPANPPVQAHEEAQVVKP